MLLLFTVQCSLYTVHGQSIAAYEKAGGKAMKQGKFHLAQSYFKIVLQAVDNPAKARYQRSAWQYAEASRQLYDFEEAQKHYEILINQGDDCVEKYPEIHFRMGQVLKQMGRYKEAQTHFTQYLQSQKDTATIMAQKAKHESMVLADADKLLEPNSTFEIQRLLPKINSPYSEFSAHIVDSNQTYYYTSYEPFEFEKTNKKGTVLLQLSRILSSKGKVLKLSGYGKQHIANSCLHPDGKQLFYTRCDTTGQANQPRCDIWVTTLGANGEWSTASKLPQSINSKNSSATQPFVSYDTAKQQTTLWFSSNRPGGQGGYDLYFSKHTKDEWGAPVNLGPVINSIDDEVTPYFDVFHKTLYFSSSWHGGLGGFDVFKSLEMEEGVFDNPENLHFPINSAANDIYFRLNAKGDSGFLASNRQGTSKLTGNACCHDIFSLELARPKPKDTIPSVVAATEIPAKPLDKEQFELFEKPKETTPQNIEKLKQLLPITLYFHNDEPDSNSLSKTTQKTYNQTFVEYFAMKDTYSDRFSKAQKKDSRAKASEEVSQFFQEFVQKGNDQKNIFCELLLEHLKAGDTLIVTLKGYTSPRATNHYNLALAQRRIESVKLEFLNWSNATLKPYLESGQLTLSETPLGETQAPKNVSDSYLDRANSIYNPAAAKERRTEVIAVERLDGRH